MAETGALIGALAAAQHSLITWGRLGRLGLSERQIDHRRATGRPGPPPRAAPPAGALSGRAGPGSGERPAAGTSGTSGHRRAADAELVGRLRAGGDPRAEASRTRAAIFDFARPERLSAVEVDGRIWHSTPAQRRRDAERDQAVRVLGWSVERVTWLDLEEDAAGVVRRLVGALRVWAAA